MTCYSRPAVRRLSGEAAAGTLENNRPAADPSPDGKRKLTCLRLVEGTNGIKLRAVDRCESERLPGSALCARHLAEAKREYDAIVAGHAEAITLNPHGWDSGDRKMAERLIFGAATGESEAP